MSEHTTGTAAPTRTSPHARADDAPSPGAYLTDLLIAQCGTAPADAGAILRLRSGGDAEVLAAHGWEPRAGSRPGWLLAALRAAERSDPGSGPLIVALAQAGPDSTDDETSAAALVLSRGEGSSLLGVYLLTVAPQAAAPRVARLRLSAGLLEIGALRHEIARRDSTLRDACRVIASGAAIAEHDRFAPGVMALCNTIAAEWACSRVSLGLLRGPSARLVAMSHTERLVRKTRLAQDIEAAMDECADQDTEIRWPVAESEAVIARAHADLSDRQGANAALSVPLRRKGEVVGVLTLERDKGPAFAASEVESVRLLAELITGRVTGLDRAGRWPGRRLLTDSARWLLGPRQTWLKAAALGVLIAAAVLTLVPGTERIDATFRVEPVERRSVPAPFDATVTEVLVRAGDAAPQPGAPLARLDDTELRLELASVLAELAAHQRGAAIALRTRNESEAQIARARAEQAEARADLLRHRIDRATITAPIAGVVILGDPQRLLGAPVREGDVLFEVAPLDLLRADAFVPEDRIGDISVGARGRLATAAYPSRRIPFVIEHIEPAAEVRQGRNVFRASLSLEDSPDWLRPGMEGSARIDGERRPLGAIWFRRLSDWVRMALWV